MRLSELQNKDVINLVDGRKIGNIIDVEIKDGKLETLIVEKNRFFWSFFTSKGEIEINFTDVQKIGNDVILVSINL